MSRTRELAELATAYDTGTPLGFRNRIINGDMRIDQRNNGAAVTTSALQSIIYTVDRWGYYNDVTSRRSIQRSTVAPPGFSHSLLVTVLSTDTSGPQQFIQQAIEANNCAGLNWGTASAIPATLSFWVRSSVTGQHGGAVHNTNRTRAWPIAYTISAANTWEYKTIPISPEATGTWDISSNGVGIYVMFEHGVGYQAAPAGAWATTNSTTSTGSVNLCATQGATWQITGVQLEAGSVATPFERRPYATEEQLCYRYFQRNLGLSGSNEGLPIQLVGGYTLANNVYKWITYPLPVRMRAIPTVTFYPNYGSTSEPGKARYFITSQGGGGNNITPYGFDSSPLYLVLKAYNEHNSFTCWGFGAGYDANAEL